MFIYENHMGGFYVSDDLQSYKDTYCEICGDSDWSIGEANTREEAWNLLKDDVDIDGSGGYGYEYVQEFLDTYFGKYQEKSSE